MGGLQGQKMSCSLCVPACVTEVSFAVLNVEIGHYCSADNVPLEKVGNASVTNDVLMSSGRGFEKRYLLLILMTIFCSQTISIGSH